MDEYSNFRDTMNLEKAYMQGRFDAIPVVNDSYEQLKNVLNGKAILPKLKDVIKDDILLRWNLFYFLPPIGLGYISTFLQLNNIQVNLIDCIASDLSVRKLKSMISSEKPDFLGINVFSPNYRLVKDMVESVKFKTHIIIGGLATKSLYTKIIQWNTNNPIDIVIGDGELVTKDIVTDNIKEKPRIENPTRRCLISTTSLAIL